MDGAAGVAVRTGDDMPDTAHAGAVLPLVASAEEGAAGMRSTVLVPTPPEGVAPPCLAEGSGRVDKRTALAGVRTRPGAWLLCEPEPDCDPRPAVVLREMFSLESDVDIAA